LKDASRQQLQLSTEALQNAKEFLKDCPSEIYYIVSQPSVSATELGATTDLKTLSSDSGVKARVTVSEVVGMKGGEGEELVRFIEEKCGATRSEGMKPIAGTGSVVVSKNFPALGSSVEEREEMLRDHGKSSHLPLVLPTRIREWIGWYTGVMLKHHRFNPSFGSSKNLLKGRKIHIYLPHHTLHSPSLLALKRETHHLRAGFQQCVAHGLEAESGASQRKRYAFGSETFVRAISVLHSRYASVSQLYEFYRLQKRQLI
jgi:hypothetical protein